MSLEKSLAGVARKAVTPTQIDLEEAIAVAPIQKKATKGQATTGKRSNPEYMQLKAYVPRTLHRQALRKWEHATDHGQDMSDLVSKLLSEYLDT